MSSPLHEWRFEVGSPDHGSRLDSFLSDRLRWRSREGVQEAIGSSRVQVLPFKDPQRANVGRLRSSLRLRLGQEVVVRLPAPQAEVEEPVKPAPVAVIYEDEHLLAIDKPAHRSVYPSRRHRSGSLIEGVHLRHRSEWGPGGYFPTPCHRLDRETSGLVLFAKSRRVRSELSLQFEERLVRKRYLAVVEGRPDETSGVIDAALGPAPSSEVDMKVGLVPGGQEARTEWRVVRSIGDVSLLELEPKTGRRHQLRVHMASIGHPLVGDKLYGGGDAVFLRSLDGELSGSDRARLGLERQALHAWRLELRLKFLRPGETFELNLEAPLPADIRGFLDERESSQDRCADRMVAS